MAKETVESLAERVAAGTMDAAEAGRKMRGLVTRKTSKTKADYYEGHHEAAVLTDPNSFLHVEALYVAGKISLEQVKAIQKAMHERTSLSEGIEYYLTDGQPAQPVRRVGDGDLEVFTSDGKWTAFSGGHTECTEAEALEAAKKIMS